jgi:hypothetical protein
VKEVLAGHLRVPLDGGSSKLLRFMVHFEEGCDGILSDDGFQVRFGWNPGPHSYFLQLAPACMSQLLSWAGISDHHDEVSAWLPATQVPARSFIPWSFSPRQFWLRREETRVLLAIRAGSEPSTLPWPDPILPWRATSPTWRPLKPSVNCPHCRRPVERARDLGDALVCPHCARSFEVP